MTHIADSRRYDTMPYRRCGASGLLLPAVSFGLWQNFGATSAAAGQRELVLHAFDRGITHFDLANRYGPPVGATEEFFGRLLAADLAPYRDELIVTSKAGYRMWPGPYGEWGSRKHLLSSLDASLRRLNTDYVDIFYCPRDDPHTPLEETIGALKTAVDSGRALYAGISSYQASRVVAAAEVARDAGLPLLVHQPSYSLLNRWVEDGEPSALGAAADAGMGTVAFSPLAQGMLTDKYLGGIPPGSRAATSPTLPTEFLSDTNLAHIRALAQIAQTRGQSLAQMAIAWVLRDERVTTALVGASSTAQLDDSLGALANLDFSDDELSRIDDHAVDAGINIWARR